MSGTWRVISGETLGATLVLLVGQLALCGASTAGAQNPSSDSARCAATLNAPTPDSVIVELHTLVFPFDTARKLPDSYGELLGEGLREMLVLPRPLPIDTYDARAGVASREVSHKQYAARTLRSFYQLTLHRDGRLTNIRVTGGVRNVSFDSAVLAAFAALDTSQLLPPPTGFDDAFDHDTLALRVTITPGSLSSARSNVAAAKHPGVTPLVRLRLPIYPVDAEAAAIPGNSAPRYPATMRSMRVEGKVRLEFLVRADGTVDPESMQALSATSLDFVASVATAVPQMHFYPMKVAGCNVATLVQMPFVFSLSR